MLMNNIEKAAEEGLQTNRFPLYLSKFVMAERNDGWKDVQAAYLKLSEKEKKEIKVEQERRIREGLRLCRELLTPASRCMGRERRKVDDGDYS